MHVVLGMTLYILVKVMDALLAFHNSFYQLLNLESYDQKMQLFQYLINLKIILIQDPTIEYQNEIQKTLVLNFDS